jgi:hypothetical protein
MSTAEDEKAKPDEEPFRLEKGLVEFYSSQADLLLAQYENINQLLGPTDDWTAPGTHCEVLLRGFLRRYLPAPFRVDKGFIYGRRDEGGKTRHCPEIDILVHDVQHFRPILQIDDFVIVPAASVQGLVQVKRMMTSSQLVDGLKNVVEGKLHFRQLCEGKTPRSVFELFSAVVFFDEDHTRKDGKPSETYNNRLEEVLQETEDWLCAPDFVGSLKHHCYYLLRSGPDYLHYVGCPAFYNQHNIALQILLWALSRKITRTDCRLPFSFPMFESDSVIEFKRAWTGPKPPDGAGPSSKSSAEEKPA